MIEMYTSFRVIQHVLTHSLLRKISTNNKKEYSDEYDEIKHEFLAVSLSDLFDEQTDQAVVLLISDK